jgi:hypothetical protein
VLLRLMLHGLLCVTSGCSKLGVLDGAPNCCGDAAPVAVMPHMGPWAFSSHMISCLLCTSPAVLCHRSSPTRCLWVCRRCSAHTWNPSGPHLGSMHVVRTHEIWSPRKRSRLWALQRECLWGRGSGERSAGEVVAQGVVALTHGMGTHLRLRAL